MDVEQALKLVAEAHLLRGRNDLRGALRALQNAHDLVWSAATGLELARVQSLIGLVTAARKTLRRILDLPSGAPERVCSTSVRENAERLDQELEKRLSFLRVDLFGLAPAAHARINVDGVHAVDAGGVLPIDPGRHEIVASTDTQRIAEVVDCREGQSATVTLTFGSATRSPYDWVSNALSNRTPRMPSSVCPFPLPALTETDSARRALGYRNDSPANIMAGAAGAGLAIGQLLIKKPGEGSAPPSTVAGSIRIRPMLGGIAVSGRF